jgi:hypothetical protein
MTDPKVVRYSGELIIDHEAGTIQFVQYGVNLLNITHLTAPIPINMVIDIVALPALTAYNKKNWKPDE